jgi:hypothetical protein
MSTLNTSNLKFTYIDQNYEWCGGFGAAVKSYERGVKQNDIRCFGNTMMHAYYVEKRLFGLLKSEVWWSLIGKENTAENIREFRQKIFS